MLIIRGLPSSRALPLHLLLKFTAFDVYYFRSWILTKFNTVQEISITNIKQNLIIFFIAFEISFNWKALFLKIKQVRDINPCCSTSKFSLFYILNVMRSKHRGWHLFYLKISQVLISKYSQNKDKLNWFRSFFFFFVISFCVCKT